MSRKNKKTAAKSGFFAFSLTAFLLLLFFLFIPKEINLSNSDIGRHLKNGEMTVSERLIPKTNFYSYTNPDFPFYNHHWLSGVVFWTIHRVSGFEGLSVFFIVISLVTFYVFLSLGMKYSNHGLTALIALAAMPVIINRHEIRPEIFSYFFCAAYLWLFYNFDRNNEPPAHQVSGAMPPDRNRVSGKILYIIPLLQIVWVNLHIYFIMGIFIGSAFWLEALINKNLRQSAGFRILTLVLISSVLASIINPYWLRGLLFPFKIFENYGYLVFENQSVRFIERIFKYPPALNFKIVFYTLAASWIFRIYKSIKEKERFPTAFFIISAAFSAMAWLAIRNFALFGYFALAISALNFKDILPGRLLKWQYLYVPAVLILTLFAFQKTNPQMKSKGADITGLVPGNEAAAQFFIQNRLKGPVFNNYDIGSYLIYHLYPLEKVFVDNRPEAYPSAFFKEVYVPMQEKEEVWLRESAKYGINAIFFYRHDVTPHGQDFLIKRVSDSQWAPVFVDANNIIFLKRIKENSGIIKKFELPKEMFQVVR
ncbi:MAG: hypothetical protein HY746_00690 [Elusimicrobia bacterium]|nr:hypothetical protein [Elusimicrobiota bacterium]